MKTTSKPEPRKQAQVHALSSGVITVLPSESPDEFHQLIAELNQQFQPESGTERFLVDQMIHARWKLARYRRLEAEALEQIGDADTATDRAILDALSKRGNILEKLERLIAAQDRAFSKAVRELNAFRTAAEKAKKLNKASAAEAWLQAELAKLPNEPNPRWLEDWPEAEPQDCRLSPPGPSVALTGAAVPAAVPCATPDAIPCAVPV